MNDLTGKLILILGSSGAGKGTLMSYLRANHPEYVFPRSWTTRKERHGDKEGKPYSFVSNKDFQEGIDNGIFAEWAEVHSGQFNGTPKDELLPALQAGKTVVHDINIDGAETLSQIIPKGNLISVFVTAPDWETLRHRIVERDDISEQDLAARKESYERERQWWPRFDHIVENKEGEPDTFVKEVEQIIAGSV